MLSRDCKPSGRRAPYQTRKLTPHERRLVSEEGAKPAQLVVAQGSAVDQMLVQERALGATQDNTVYLPRAFAGSEQEERVVRHEAGHIGSWQQGVTSPHRLQFYTKPDHTSVEQEHELVDAVKHARWVPSPSFAFTKDFTKDIISRFSYAGLHHLHEELTATQEHFEIWKKNEVFSEMLSDWRREHVEPVFQLHRVVRKRLPTWKETVLQARDADSYGSHPHLGIRIASWFDKAWPEAQEIIRTAVEEKTPELPVQPAERWGYLTEPQVDRFLRRGCLAPLEKSEVVGAMDGHLVPNEVATLFFERDSPASFMKGLEGIDRRVRDGMQKLLVEYGQLNDGQDLGAFGGRIGEMIVPETVECKEQKLDPASVKLWDALDRIKTTSEIYPYYMIEAPRTTSDRLVERKMSEFEAKLRPNPGVDVAEFEPSKVNLSGQTSLADLNDLLDG